MEGQLPESRIEAMVRMERLSQLSGTKSDVFLALRVPLSTLRAEATFSLC